MKRFKRFLVFFAVLAGVAVAAPFFISLDRFVPEIERQASVALKQPVKVGGLRIGLLPLPHAAATGLVIGGKPAITVGALKLFPEFGSLFGPNVMIGRVELHDVVAPGGALAVLAGSAGGDGGGQGVRVRQIVLRKVTVPLQDATLGPLRADLELTPEGKLGAAAIVSEDEKLTVAIRPDGENFRVDARATRWKPPMGPAVLLDEVHLEAVVNARRVSARQLQVRLYGGTVEGAGGLSWHEGWQTSGELRAKGVELRELAPLLAKQPGVSGRLDGRAHFSSRAREAGGLWDASHVKASFSVQDGVLRKVNLDQAAKSLGKGGVGGETRFDELSGNVQLANGYTSLSDLRIVSGMIDASGNVGISRTKQLSGRLEVQLKGSGGFAGVPLALSGSTDEPVLRPTNGALAGAVAGTALLGPGLGTTLGVKAGSAMERLFGSR